MPKGKYVHKQRRLFDITGQRFGKLVAVECIKRTGNNGSHWLVRCDCGKEKIIASRDLRSGRSKHCGCNRVLLNGGASGRPEYASWKAMIYRCTRPTSDNFYHYGGRGIKVCDKWLNDFWAFLSDIGERPSRLYSLDRINNDGNYEPGNVRWATPKEQSNNQRIPVSRLRFSDYQERAGMSATYPDKKQIGGLIYCALGACGEMGEVANKVKKIIRDCNGVVTEPKRQAIVDEIGDCLWYLSQLCSELGIDFSRAAKLNLEKVVRRRLAGTIQGDGDNR